MEIRIKPGAADEVTEGEENRPSIEPWATSPLRGCLCVMDGEQGASPKNLRREKNQDRGKPREGGASGGEE